MIYEADKKVIDTFQEVYLFFYDLTGITVGMTLFVNMILQFAFFMVIASSITWFFILLMIFLTFYYYFLHVIQTSDKIKLFNALAINWENGYVTRVMLVLMTLFFFVMTEDWRFAIAFLSYLIGMYGPAIKIRERDKDRFKIVKLATA